MLMTASEVADNLSKSGTTVPVSERQARPLSRLPADEQPEAWEAASNKAKEEGRPVTARDVEEVVEERRTVTTKRHKGDNADSRRFIEAANEIVKLIQEMEGLNLPNAYRPDAVARCENLEQRISKMTERIRKLQ